MAKSDNEPTMAEVMARLADLAEMQVANQQNQTLVQKEQLKQTRRRNNANPPMASPFNPQGEKDHPMPRLKCEFWMPWISHPNYHGHTWEEVELLNLIEPGHYWVEMKDGTRRACNVLGTKHMTTGAVTKMQFVGEIDDRGNYGGFYTREVKNDVPGLVVMLREMLEQKGIDHSGVMSMKERQKRADASRELMKKGEPVPVDDARYLPVSVGE